MYHIWLYSRDHDRRISQAIMELKRIKDIDKAAKYVSDFNVALGHSYAENGGLILGKNHVYAFERYGIEDINMIVNHERNK